jgi:hypothetical protein
MSRRMYEHMCPAGHITEHYVSYEMTEMPCTVCGTDASRIISAPRVELDGTDPVYVSAYDRWAKRHEDKAKQERKQNEA